MPDQQHHFCPEPIPAQAGIGLRGPHYKDIVETRPHVGFVEVHSENYFAPGGPPHWYLHKIRNDYPLSFHGVGLSLGSTDPLSQDHVTRLKQLIEIYQPDFISEHLSWGSIGGRHLNDLLPMPYTEEAVGHISDRISQVQDALGRKIMVENVSCYLQFEQSQLTEWEFVSAVAERADCEILLDVNNIYVNAHNHNFDCSEFLNGIDGDYVKEVHLAGHTVKEYEQGKIIIDTHDHRVCDEVWALYAETIRHCGEKPTLIEWDTDLPALEVLIEEADTAQNIMTEITRARVA